MEHCNMKIQRQRRLCTTLAMLLCTALVRGQAGAEEGEDQYLPVMLTEGNVYIRNRMELFCYEFTQKPVFTDNWSAVKIIISSPEQLRLTYPSDEIFFNKSETLKDLIVYFYYQVVSSNEKVTSEFNLSVEHFDSKACFKLNPMKSNPGYTVTVTKPSFELKLIILFVTGIILFVFARPISRSELLYYSCGVTLGIFAILVLILLVCRRMIQTRTFFFLMAGSGSVSLLAIYLTVLNLSLYRKFFVGYIFVLGCISYIICYKHGPLSDELSINLLTWTLQLIALLMIYCGVTFSQCAYTVIVILLCANNIHHPVNLISYIYRNIKRFITKPRIHFITEEEYREQTEMETKKALEELRLCCRSQDFPTWEMVSKISTPKRAALVYPTPQFPEVNVQLLHLADIEGEVSWYHITNQFKHYEISFRLADFILGASHLTHEELWMHDQHYGIGGSFLEAQLFAAEEENSSVVQNGEAMAVGEGHEVDETVY